MFLRRVSVGDSNRSVTPDLSVTWAAAAAALAESYLQWRRCRSYWLLTVARAVVNTVLVPFGGVILNNRTMQWAELWRPSLLNENRPTRTLRSYDKPLFTIPFCRLSLRNQAFQYKCKNVPRVWNNLNHDCRAGSSIACFKRNLKTELFNVAYPV